MDHNTYRCNDRDDHNRSLRPRPADRCHNSAVGHPVIVTVLHIWLVNLPAEVDSKDTAADPNAKEYANGVYRKQKTTTHGSNGSH